MKLIERFKAAAKAFREGALPVIEDIEADAYKWRRLSGTDRDLTPLMQERAQQIAYYLYETNPMAKRLVNMTAEYVVSEGIKVKSEDAEVQDFLTDFWTENKLDALLLHFVKEFGLWGEQCYRLFVNDVNGRTSLGYLDPGRIQEVALDPDNCLVIDRVVLHSEKDPLNGETLQPVRKLALAEDGSIYTGDTLFFKTNSVLKASRGRSDILACADYLDLYSEFVFSRGERSIFGNVWMWDVKCEGMDKKDLDEFVKNHPPPKPGALRAHNEKVTWAAVAPDLKAHDASYDARMLKSFNLGAIGYPEHFYGEAGDVNRATATEMNEPVIKMLTSRQREVRFILADLCDFALDKGRAKRIIKPKAENKPDYHLYFPELSSKDMQKSGLTMQYLAQSLSIAEQAGWVTKEAAARVYAQVASTFGPNVNPAYEDDQTWFDKKKKEDAQKPKAPVKPSAGTQIPAGSQNGKAQ